MAIAKQKDSKCFRTHEYAVTHCRVSSYLQPVAHQG